MQAAEKQVVLSGIRPTGRLHLGNYLGAVRQFAALSRRTDLECFFFVADWHALTTVRTTGTAMIGESLPDVVLDYLAAGVDLATSAIYVQSSVPETIELAWYLACLTPTGDLQRVPNYKDKIAKGADNNAGLLMYPVLMAADILGIRANLVPVGADQVAHLEMAVALARRFNRVFKRGLFPEPAAFSLEEKDPDQKAIVVPSLDGAGKMGKSESTVDGIIFLADSPEEVRRKIQKAKTDPARQRRNDKGNPDVCNIHLLHRLVSSAAEVARCAEGCRTAAIGCADCKAILNGNVNTLLAPLQARRQELAADKDMVVHVLHTGNQKARAAIAATVAEARQLVGIARWE